jgi:hypothetical protein
VEALPQVLAWHVAGSIQVAAAVVVTGTIAEAEEAKAVRLVRTVAGMACCTFRTAGTAETAGAGSGTLHHTGSSLASTSVDTSGAPCPHPYPHPCPYPYPYPCSCSCSCAGVVAANHSLGASHRQQRTAAAAAEVVGAVHRRLLSRHCCLHAHAHWAFVAAGTQRQRHCVRGAPPFGQEEWRPQSHCEERPPSHLLLMLLRQPLLLLD